MEMAEQAGLCVDKVLCCAMVLWWLKLSVSIRACLFGVLLKRFIMTKDGIVSLDSGDSAEVLQKSK